MMDDIDGSNCASPGQDRINWCLSLEEGSPKGIPERESQVCGLTVYSPLVLVMIPVQDHLLVSS